MALVARDGFVEVEEGAGDGGEGGKLHRVRLLRGGLEADLQQGVGVFGLLEVALELLVVERLEEGGFLGEGIAVEELYFMVYCWLCRGLPADDCGCLQKRFVVVCRSRTGRLIAMLHGGC